MKSMLMLAVIVTAAATLSPAPARASTMYSNAVDQCQGSLPSFEGALRKRPLAIANEGTTNSFVSCSIQRLTGDSTFPVRVYALFTNRAATAQTVSCTLVDGVALPFPVWPPIYIPKAVAIIAGDYAVLEWNTSDNGGNAYRLPNLNCQLVPGMEINLLQIDTTAIP